MELHVHRSTCQGLDRRKLEARLFAARHRGVRAVAGHAILRRGFVEQDRLVGNGFGEFVTLRAFDVLMGATQSENRPLVVVEQGGLPFYAVVAVGAGGSFPFGELFSVDVLMAVLA